MKKIDRIIETESNIRAWCIATLRTITPDGRVSEETTADILGVEVRTLQNRRSLGTAPPHYRQAVGASRYSYSLKDVAIWLEMQREAPPFYEDATAPH